jgi:hypothetical protein
MFSTEFNSSRPGAAPLLAGFAITTTAVLLLGLLPPFLLEEIEAGVKMTMLPLAVLPKARPLHPSPSLRPPVMRSTPNATGVAGAEQPYRPTQSQPVASLVVGAITVYPGSAAWVAHVDHGREVSFDIYAVDSVPVLSALGVTLAFDISRPRGEVNMYDLSKNKAFRGFVGPNVIVREILGGITGIPALDEVRRQAEIELGAPPRLFSLWPPDVYHALKSTTEAALRQAFIAPDSVRTAHVHLQPAGEKGFTLRLTRMQGI